VARALLGDSTITSTPRLFIDVTAGTGGHAAHILEADSGAHMVLMDIDGSALQLARARLSPFSSLTLFLQRPFSECGTALAAAAARWPALGCDGYAHDPTSPLHYNGTLEGLQPGFNRGGSVDTHDRYIYIHGTSDQKSVGRPASHGCIHLADPDLIALYDQVPSGTLVWISADSA
jgi:hypothetical protein